MIANPRQFDAADPFGRTWAVTFRWQQTAISIRHADAVDVKWHLQCGEEQMEKVIALPHPLLLDLSRESGRVLTDPWCMKLAAAHLLTMLDTWQDMDKQLVTLTRAELKDAAATAASWDAEKRELAYAAE
jgi:hypothetical protein